MNSKRPNDQGQSSGPPTKKALVQFEPVKIGPVYSLEDMDIKVLQFQNKKLVERIEHRRKAEDELKRRIEQLEQRQATDDAVLCIVNRYWNQLDEDVRVLLQRFDAEGADEAEKQNESAAVTSFLTLLSQWDKQEIEHKLNQRVEFSKRAIGKLLQAYDRLLQRKEKLWNSIKNKKEVSVKVEEEPKEEGTNVKQEEGEDKDKEMGEEKDNEKAGDAAAAEVHQEARPSLNDTIMEEMDRLVEENKRLQNLITETHEKHHEITHKNLELQDKLAATETELAELKNHLEEVEYHCETTSNRAIKMDKYLNEVVAKLKTYQEGEIKVQGGGEGVSKNKFNEISVEMEEQRELATTRLGELEKLQEEHEQVLKEAEKLKMDLSMLPESVIIETTEYKCLQSQFSVLYNEATQMKTQLDECKNLLDVSSASHLKQIQQMEADELSMQKKLRTEMIETEDGHAQVRREYDLLRSEFELTLTANEQTGPINREMRNLITSLKNHNEQLKGEIQRYKRKLKEAHTEIQKLRQENSSSAIKQPTQEQETSSVPDATKEQEENEKNKQELETIKELKNEIKKLQEKERETKLHWESLKTMSKDGRDKSHQVAASEKKARLEMEELKNQIRKLQQEVDKKERKKYSDDEISKKVKKYEETIADLQKSLASQKQEEEAMLNEMEVTGQAFEDMQEQNVRLLQQLREKDDANFKLMSERIKSNQIQKLLRDEKDVLNEQVETLQHQLDAQNVVVRKLEEKEHLLMTTINSLDKELTLKQQALELHKRKAVESVQSATDLKLHLDKYQAQLKEAQTAVTDKTAALQQQSFKYRRMQEEVATIRKKLDRAKKIEMASSADEVLMEEIREYKEQLTCPSCKVKKKDAVLTKCFHVFCLECLKTRYETRQRKCPKCNATFGANDYHRIYLE